MPTGRLNSPEGHTAKLTISGRPGRHISVLCFSITSYPIDTRRHFNVDTTSCDIVDVILTLKRRLVSTGYIHWGNALTNNWRKFTGNWFIVMLLKNKQYLEPRQSVLYSVNMIEAASGGVLRCKKGVLKTVTLLKRNSNTGAFLWNLRHLFWRTSGNHCF